MSKTPEEIAAEITTNFRARKDIACAIAAEREATRAAVLAERERCAEVARDQARKDTEQWTGWTDWRQPYAANRVIRASWAIAERIMKPEGER